MGHFLFMTSSNVILSSERLNLLRVDKTSDVELQAKFLFELLNDENWIKYIGDRNIKTLNDAKDLVVKYADAYEKNGYGVCLIQLKEDEKKFVGIAGLLKRDYLETLDIGFALLTNETGKGFAFEICKEILKDAELRFNFNNVAGITLETNEKSVKLLEKLGLKFEKKIQNEKEEELLLYK